MSVFGMFMFGMSVFEVSVRLFVVDCCFVGRFLIIILHIGPDLTTRFM